MSSSRGISSISHIRQLRRRFYLTISIVRNIRPVLTVDMGIPPITTLLRCESSCFSQDCPQSILSRITWQTVDKP